MGGAAGSHGLTNVSGNGTTVAGPRSNTLLEQSDSRLLSLARDRAVTRDRHENDTDLVRNRHE
jgi:hypothetical protein